MQINTDTEIDLYTDKTIGDLATQPEDLAQNTDESELPHLNDWFTVNHDIDESAHNIPMSESHEYMDLYNDKL